MDLAAVAARLDEPHATDEWCASIDAILPEGASARHEAVDALSEIVRMRFLRTAWGFDRADHAINMLAGYAQRRDAVPERHWRIYLAFDRAELPPADMTVLRAELARPGDRVERDPSRWRASDFDVWGRGDGVGMVVRSPLPLADLGKVDVRWPAGRCVEDVVALRWL